MLNRYLMPMLVIAVAMGVYFLYIDKTWKGIAEFQAQEKAVEGLLLDAQNAREALDKVVAESRSFPTDADARLKILLPDTLDPTKLVIDINAIAELHGLTLRSPLVEVSQHEPDMPKDYLTHTIRFKVISTYDIFRAFLKDVESSLAIRDFAGISIESSSAQDDTNIKVDPAFMVFEYDVTLITYSLN